MDQRDSPCYTDSRSVGAKELSTLCLMRWVTRLAILAPEDRRSIGRQSLLPSLRSPRFSGQLKLAFATAQRAIERLEGNGIVRQVSVRGCCARAVRYS
jgi:hypothetical protein